MDEKEQSQKVAGRVFLQAQLVGWIALGIGIAWAFTVVDYPTRATGAGLMFVAAAVAFGMLANAVLRK